MTDCSPSIVKLEVNWATQRIGVAFVELAPWEYVLDYDLEVVDAPEPGRHFGSLARDGSIELDD